jgi:hypothetical protein
MHQMRISTTKSLFSGTQAEKIGNPKKKMKTVKEPRGPMTDPYLSSRAFHFTTYSRKFNTEKYNKRPMGHIAHLSNTGSYENTFRILLYISFPFAPPDPQEP